MAPVKTSLLLILFLMIPVCARADEIALFRNDIGAYSSALGGALTAEPGSVYSQYYNPAASACSPSFTLESTIFTLYETNMKEGSFLFPSEWGVFSGSFLYGSMDGFLYTALDSNNRPYASGGTFGYNAMKMLFSWADQMSRFFPEVKELDPLYLGLQFEYQAEHIEKASGAFWGLNVGSLYVVSEQVYLGAAWKNLLQNNQTWSGGQAKAVEKIDSYLNVGGKVFVIPQQLSVNLDYSLFLQSAKPRLGVSYQLINGTYLMAGTGDSALQLGLHTSYSGLNFDCAYASAKNENLSDAYRFSLGYVFQPGVSAYESVRGRNEQTPDDLLAAYPVVDEDRKTLILSQLAAVGHPRIYTLLSDSMKSGTVKVKIHAMKILVEYFPQAAINPLLDCLFDGEKPVKINAVSYLAELGDQKVAEIINQLIPFENDPETVYAFSEALSRLKTKI